MTAVDPPDLAALLGGVLQRVPRAHRPLFIAIAERMAAERYRIWAKETRDDARAPHLLACAEREEEIARRVESLYDEADSVRRELLEQNPDLEEINRSIFADRPLEEQFTIQARGERAGAATWRYFAQHAESETTREEFLRCAELEEESAACLESLLDGRR